MHYRSFLQKVLICVMTFFMLSSLITYVGYAEETEEVSNEENQEEIPETEVTEEVENENSEEQESVNSQNNTENERGMLTTISSRSEVNRLGRYVDLTPEEPTEKYEELVEYIKLEDVKISFDMDVSKTTGLSKEDFISLVQNMKYDKTGILAKNAGWIWECCQKYSVNEIFVLGICGIESGWCSAPQHQNTHNYSSLMSGGKLIAYPSDEAGFEAMIKLLGEKYLSPNGSLYHGATITGVGRCYCNPTSWPQKVYTCMQQVFQ